MLQEHWGTKCFYNDCSKCRYIYTNAYYKKQILQVKLKVLKQKWMKYLYQRSNRPRKREMIGKVRNYIDAMNSAIKELETLPIFRLIKNIHAIL